MTCRESYPEPDIDMGSGVGTLRRRYIPLFTILIGVLAAMNVASVVFVLLE
jgi:hypothetical protein